MYLIRQNEILNINNIEHICRSNIDLDFRFLSGKYKTIEFLTEMGAQKMFEEIVFWIKFKETDPTALGDCLDIREIEAKIREEEQNI